MNILTLPELMRLQEALHVKRILEKRIDSRLHMLSRCNRREIVKTRIVDNKCMQHIFYAYIAKQNKDIDNDKLVILPIEYYNHGLFNNCVAIPSDKAYSKPTESASAYLLQTDRILFTIDEVINKFNRKFPTTHNEITLYARLLNNSKDYNVMLHLLKALIKEEMGRML